MPNHAARSGPGGLRGVAISSAGLITLTYGCIKAARTAGARSRPATMIAGRPAGRFAAGARADQPRQGVRPWSSCRCSARRVQLGHDTGHAGVVRDVRHHVRMPSTSRRSGGPTRWQRPADAAMIGGMLRHDRRTGCRARAGPAGPADSTRHSPWHSRRSSRRRWPGPGPWSRPFRGDGGRLAMVPSPPSAAAPVRRRVVRGERPRLGVAMPSAMNAALGRCPDRSGAGSALITAMRQVGATIGSRSWCRAQQHLPGAARSAPCPPCQCGRSSVARRDRGAPDGSAALLASVRSAFVDAWTSCCWTARHPLASALLALAFLPGGPDGAAASRNRSGRERRTTLSGQN